MNYSIDNMMNDYVNNTTNNSINNSINKKDYYMSFTSPKKLFNELLEKGEYPMTIAVKYGLKDLVIYIDDLLRNNPSIIEKHDIKPQWHDERFCISWVHVRIAMEKKNYQMVKLLCSRMRRRYFNLKKVVAYQWEQMSACSDVLEMGIKDFDKDINNFFIGLFCKKGYTREQFTSNRIKSILEADNNDVLKFYKPVFKISHFNQALFYGYVNCIKWMEKYQPEICVLEENHNFFEYPFRNRPFEMMNENNLPALKMYYKYLGEYHHPSHYYYILKHYNVSVEFQMECGDNIEMFEFLTELHKKYFRVTY